MWKSFTRSEDVPQVLDSLDLPGIVKYMQSEQCENVFVMAGAGISTAAGIPDFRSPDTGLYANLARLNLPYPEAVFDISFFRRNPRPFYTLAHELAPGKFRPTLTHSFIRLLAEKGLLHTCFTQNIDTLERRAGVPPAKIIEAHGSFASQHCIKCGASYPDDEIKQKIETKELPICKKKSCGGYVKPDIVFFGESLPAEFHTRIPHLRNADLLIVMGTSLTVHPFASLTERVGEDCPRLLLNLDNVGGWGSRVNDVACLMKCDDAVRELCKLLGWEEELDRLWAETAPPGEKVVDEEKKDAKKEVDDLVDELAKDVGKVTLEQDSQPTSQQTLEAVGDKAGDSVEQGEPKADQVESSAYSNPSSAAQSHEEEEVPGESAPPTKGAEEEGKVVKDGDNSLSSHDREREGAAKQGDTAATSVTETVKL